MTVDCSKTLVVTYHTTLYLRENIKLGKFQWYLTGLKLEMYLHCYYPLLTHTFSLGSQSWSIYCILQSYTVWNQPWSLIYRFLSTALLSYPYATHHMIMRCVAPAVSLLYCCFLQRLSPSSAYCAHKNPFPTLILSYWKGAYCFM